MLFFFDGSVDVDFVFGDLLVDLLTWLGELSTEPVLVLGVFGFYPGLVIRVLFVGLVKNLFVLLVLSLGFRVLGVHNGLIFIKLVLSILFVIVSILIDHVDPTLILLLTLNILNLSRFFIINPVAASMVLIADLDRPRRP